MKKRKKKSCDFVKEKSENYFSKKIRFSRHAKLQMKWREITQQEVISAIEHPEQVYETINQRTIAVSNVHNKSLKVVYTVENDNIIVITAINKSRVFSKIK